jgi:hypothetical protein
MNSDDDNRKIDWTMLPWVKRPGKVTGSVETVTYRGFELKVTRIDFVFTGYINNHLVIRNDDEVTPLSTVVEKVDQYYDLLDAGKDPRQPWDL